VRQNIKNKQMALRNQQFIPIHNYSNRGDEEFIFGENQHISFQIQVHETRQCLEFFDNLISVLS